jgi:hypothetical protein
MISSYAQDVEERIFELEVDVELEEGLMCCPEVPVGMFCERQR